MAIALSTEIDISEPEDSSEESTKSKSYIVKGIAVEPEVWMDARIKSIREGVSLSAVIRDFLKSWTYNEKTTAAGVERAD